MNGQLSYTTSVKHPVALRVAGTRYAMTRRNENCVSVRIGNNDRRRSGQENEVASQTLESLPALVVLRRLPTPILAMDEEGIILFSNDAFAEMIGEESVSVGTPIADLLVSQLWGKAADYRDRVVRLQHRESDTTALVAFQDLTDHLWMSG